MPSNHHERLIKLYAKQVGGQTTGFRRAVTALMADNEYWEGEGFEVPNVRPDLFKVTPYEVTMWEVEVSHPVEPEKLEELAWLRHDLDYCDPRIEVRLFTIDRYGKVEERDLIVPFYAMLLEQAPAAVLVPAGIDDPKSTPKRPKQCLGCGTKNDQCRCVA